MIIKSNVNISISYLCVLSLLLFCACGQAPETPSGQGDTGIYRPHLVFPESVSGKTAKALSGFDCEENGVVSVEFNFILNMLQYGPHTYPCEDHHASIPGVPAGKGVSVEVFADDGAGNSLYEGSEVVDIIRDQVTPGGEIQMQPINTQPTITFVETSIELHADYMPDLSNPNPQYGYRTQFRISDAETYSEDLVLSWLEIENNNARDINLEISGNGTIRELFFDYTNICDRVILRIIVSDGNLESSVDLTFNILCTY